jgi:hypothetical protein
MLEDLRERDGGIVSKTSLATAGLGAADGVNNDREISPNA